jgi:hypothetical protein
MNRFTIRDDTHLTDEILSAILRRPTLASDTDEAGFIDECLPRLIARYGAEDRERLLVLASPGLCMRVAQRVAERAALIEASRREAEDAEDE